jgi:hypothetical protein
MSAPYRIDVHQHVVPPFWAKALPTHGGDPSGVPSGDFTAKLDGYDGRGTQGDQPWQCADPISASRATARYSASGATLRTIGAIPNAFDKG